jgi:hypothetical protein
MKTTLFFFCFFNILKKTECFNIRFVSLRYKNTNQYCAKLIEKYTGKKILKRFFGFFKKIGLGLAQPLWSGPTLSGPEN